MATHVEYRIHAGVPLSQRYFMPKDSTGPIPDIGATVLLAKRTEEFMRDSFKVVSQEWMLGETETYVYVWLERMMTHEERVGNLEDAWWTGEEEAVKK